MKKTRLSVNINKIATLRNARGGNIPDLCYFAQKVLELGAGGITIHPRPDQRHIRYQDVWDIKKLMQKYPSKELNIEGYPSTKFIQLVQKIQPDQCTLVPDPPDVITSNAGWDFYKKQSLLKKTIQELRKISIITASRRHARLEQASLQNTRQELKRKNIRVSLFLDPLKMNSQQYQALKEIIHGEISPDRVELYTEAYARHFRTNKTVLAKYKACAQTLVKMGIGINAGHDLNQENLFPLLQAIPQIQEVSIGQALIAESLEHGLLKVIRSYLKIINTAYKNQSD